jgi:myo-inositol 2-dehydrogenase / D-chiro-inositol 1-dehydrogenase
VVIRVGVLGAGRIGRLHAELIDGEVDGLDLGGVHDPNAEAAAELATRTFGSVEELLAEVDAAAICTSTDTHVDLIVRAAQAGKAIFCEKPISLELAEVDRALAAVDTASAYLQVGFNRRFDPRHRAVRAAVESGDLGALQLLRITSRDPSPPAAEYLRVSGGIFLDMSIHDFDMARFVTGSEVEEVYARGEARAQSAAAALGDFDAAVTVLRHADGTLTTIDNSRHSSSGYDQRVEVLGSRGVAASENPEPLPTSFLDRYRESYVAEWNAFAAALSAGGASSPASGADGRTAVAIGLAATRSAREGRAVALAEIG